MFFVYDLRNKIMEYMIYNDVDIDKFNDVMTQGKGKKQDSVAIGKLSSILKPVVDRYNDLDHSERYKFRDLIYCINKQSC
jgi:type I restriction enzyme R subunit